MRRPSSTFARRLLDLSLLVLHPKCLLLSPQGYLIPTLATCGGWVGGVNIRWISSALDEIKSGDFLEVLAGHGATFPGDKVLCSPRPRA